MQKLWVIVPHSAIFFQAEDGIRDSVASRGLGDVYKRQVKAFFILKSTVFAFPGVVRGKI